VVVAAPDFYGVFFEKPHIGRRLARIQKLCLAPFEKFDRFRRVSGYAAHAL